jgi:hypothetical protein
MWFTDDGHDREGHNLIGRITPGGSVSEFPISTQGADPVAIALGSEGNMWFTEPGVSKVGRITAAGQITEFSVPGVGTGLNGIIRGSDGNMWFSGGAQAGINWVDPEGVVRTLPPAIVGNGGYSLAPGAEGDIWFIEGGTSGADWWLPVESYIGRFPPPKPPTNVAVPTLAGEPIAGHLMSASSGSWSQESAEITYQWQRCESDGDGCSNIAGATTQTYFMSEADAAHRLRAAVTATDFAGSDTATSALSEPVAGPPSSPLATHGEVPSPTAQVLPINMTWRFAWTATSTTVRQLAAQGVPAGTKVEITCRGRGCPLAHIGFTASTATHACRHTGCPRLPALSGGELTLTRLLAGRGLRPSDQLDVRFTAAGELGRVFAFSIQRNRAPVTRTTCVTAGSGKLATGC